MLAHAISLLHKNLQIAPEISVIIYINVAFNLYKTSKNISSMLGVGTKVISTLFEV